MTRTLASTHTPHLQTQLRQVLKDEAVGDLERRMHTALDQGLEAMKKLVADDIRGDLQPQLWQLRDEVEGMKTEAGHGKR